MKILRFKAGYATLFMHNRLHYIATITCFILCFLVNISIRSQSIQSRLEVVRSAPVSNRPYLIDGLIGSFSQYPVIENDTVITFLYRGKASLMAITGDVNHWQMPGLPMTRIAGTELWYRRDTLEADARIEYKFIRDSRDWILDPLNPQQAEGGFGFNSEIKMPHYKSPPELEFNPDIPHGKLSDTLFYSANLNNSRKIGLYLPPDYHLSSDNFPLVLFNDGWDYVNFAKVPHIIDNLIWEKKIEPIIVVFVPALDRTAEYAGSLQPAFTKFIIQELWGWIREQYRVKKDPASHAIIGASNGGNISLWISFHHPDLFGKTGVQSTNVQVKLQRAFFLFPGSDLKIYMHSAKYDIPVIQIRSRWLIQTLIRKNYPFRLKITNEGHNWKNWGAQLPEMLEWFFPR